MENLWNMIISSAVVSAAVVALVGFIGRSIIQLYLQGSIESHKAKLQGAFFRSQKVYERKLDILSKLYGLSVTAGEAVKLVVSTEARNLSQDEILKLSEDVDQFKKYYLSHHIWLDSDCCEKMDSLLAQHGAFNEVLTIKWIKEEGQGKGWTNERLVEIHKEAADKLPEAQKKLRQAFQKTLCVLEGEEVKK